MSEPAPTLILIASAPQDLHATAVAEHIRALGGRAEIFDISQYPAATTISMWCGGEGGTSITLPTGARLDAREILSVWWRRPQRPQVSAAVVEASHRRFAENEATFFLNGFWQSLDCHWINPVVADSAASAKPYQLRVAPRVGLRVPDTLMTNDPGAAAEFIERHGGVVIYKALAGLPDAWRETRLLRAEERALLPMVRHTPVVFQQYVEGTDLRVTVVGGQIFAGEMETSRSRYPFDIRMDMTVPTRAVTLDDKTAAGIHGLMRRLGLVYGAIDMKRDHEGRLYFLEINPAGQFLFMEDLTGLPISRALARNLMRLPQEEESDAKKKTARRPTRRHTRSTEAARAAGARKSR